VRCTGIGRVAVALRAHERQRADRCKLGLWVALRVEDRERVGESHALVHCHVGDCGVQRLIERVG